MKKEIEGVFGKDDEFDAQIAELAELRELVVGEGDDDLLALIDQYTGEEVGIELKLYTEAVIAWLVAGKPGNKPDRWDYLARAIGRACHRANLRLKSRPRG
mgnify:CR=1 FL=1